MIGLTAKAQNELCVARQELRKYKSLKLTSEQEKYLENFVNFLINNAHMLRCFISNRVITILSVDRTKLLPSGLMIQKK